MSGALEKEQKSAHVKSQIAYELLRLKYVKCLLAGDNVTALFLLRNELSKFEQFFPDEKKQLSQFFLLKSKKEIIRESGLDVNNRFFLEEFLKNLEQRDDGEDLGGNGLFEDWVKRYLAYELMSCTHHRPNTHELLSTSRRGGYNGKQVQKRMNGNHSQEPKLATAKTKKIVKKETANLAKRERKRKRMKHSCQPRTFDLVTKHELKNSKDEVWRLKFSEDCKYIIAATKAKSLYCWAKRYTQGRN